MAASGTAESLDRNALLARLADALEPRAEVLEAYLFGSRGRGDARAGSDIDVAVYINQDLAEKALVGRGHWGYQAALISDLMLVLETNDIDVVVLNDAPPLLYHRVLRDGVRILSRDLRATTTRAGRALSRYFDFVPFLDKMEHARRR